MRFLMILINLLIVPIVMGTPQSAKSWKEAIALAQKSHSSILLFVHGSDWNRLGEKFRCKIWEKENFQSQLGDDLVMLGVDFLESPDQKQKKSFESATKGLKIKFRSYPVLALYDSSGKMYASWLGADFPLMTSQTVALITHEMDQKKKQEAYLEEAKQLKGVKKAQALYLAAEAQSGKRTEIIKLLKICDPDNKSGYLSLLEFDGRKALKHANSLVKKKKFAEAIAWLDAQWDQPKLNTEQKQWILAAKGNVYRRWGAGHLREMDQAFMAAYRLDPESIVGKACFRLNQKFSPERSPKK